MNHKQKDLKLVKGLSIEEIPYSKIDSDGILNINIPTKVKMLSQKYNQLTDENIGYVLIEKNQSINNIVVFINLKNICKRLSIQSNKSLTKITGFNNLIEVGQHITIKSNESLTEISGFDNLINVRDYLWIQSNKSLTEITGFGNLINVSDYFSIQSNKSLTEITGFDNLVKVGLYLSISYNQQIIKITGFNNLTSVGWDLSIKSNESLTEITGFNNLKEIGDSLFIHNNPKLVTMSIPGNLVRAVDYGRGYGIVYDNDLKFKSPGEFINSPVIMYDLVTKFNPGDHGDVVVKQIVENIEEWGTEDTKYKVYSFLGKHLTPEQLKLAPTHIQYRYHPDYQGTTGRDVAKVNSGEVYGIF